MICNQCFQMAPFKHVNMRANDVHEFLSLIYFVSLSFSQCYSVFTVQQHGDVSFGVTDDGLLFVLFIFLPFAWAISRWPAHPFKHAFVLFISMFVFCSCFCLMNILVSFCDSPSTPSTHLVFY